MSYKLQLFTELSENMKVQTANLISAYTKGELGEKPQMLPVEVSDIWQKHLGLVATNGNVFVGYIGASGPTPHNGLEMSEVGSLWVPASYRRDGIAHLLVASITHNLQELDEQPYAFCNPLSRPIFVKSGYVDAKPESIPSIAFAQCIKCPMKPVGGQCCDETLVYGVLE